MRLSKPPERVLACRVKGLPYGRQWDAGCLGFAQVVETGHSHIVRNTNAALLKALQRAECHAVICRDNRLDTEPALLQQNADRRSSAFGRVIAIDNQVFVKTQIVCLEFILIGLETLLGIDLTLMPRIKAIRL